MRSLTAAAVLSVCFLWSSSVQAELVLLQIDEDTIVDTGPTLVSLGFDASADLVWVYSDSGTTLRSFSRSGVLQSSITRPGESADDADITFAPEALTLGATNVAAGTLLFINGESGVAEIYAVDKTDGTVLATLTTDFGLSHVVGGSYHAGRNTFFLVQDFQPSGTANDSLVAEIDPVTGDILNTFHVDLAPFDFDVNFGDIEVAANGNLFLVSSAESDRMAEFTPTGTFVQDHAVPSAVGSASGLGFDFGRGEAWISDTSGNIWRLGGAPAAEPVPEPGSLVLACMGVFGAGIGWFRRKASRRSATST